MSDGDGEIEIQIEIHIEDLSSIYILQVVKDARYIAVH
jgi:hypothetical protein